MGRLIDADALVDAISKKYSTDGTVNVFNILRMISDQPECEPRQWIPCKSRTDVNCEHAYCYCQLRKYHGRWCEVLFWDGFNWYKADGSPFNAEDNNVLAWYPLPSKPYREETP